MTVSLFSFAIIRHKILQKTTHVNVPDDLNHDDVKDVAILCDLMKRVPPEELAIGEIHQTFVNFNHVIRSGLQMRLRGIARGVDPARQRQDGGIVARERRATSQKI